MAFAEDKQRIGQVFRARTHEELIPMTPRAGQVLLLYAVLFAIGLAYG